MKRYYNLHIFSILIVFNCFLPTGELRGQLPEINCLNGLSVPLSNTQQPQVQLWASDFLLSASPANGEIALRRAGTGTGFPLNPDGSAQTSLSFVCADLGLHQIELWIRDMQGNTASCQTTIEIFDIAGACQTHDTRLCVDAATEKNFGIEGVTIENVGSINGMPTFVDAKTNPDGYVCLEDIYPAGTSVCITPTLDDEPLNGVDVLDLSLITKHILGIEPLNSPYKLIAADANKSGSLSTFDVVELKKLILHQYESLPNNSSWRFINAAQVFGNPQNPFGNMFGENNCVTIPDSASVYMKFVGVKIGDVNLSAKVSSKSPTLPPSDSLAGGIDERGPDGAIYYFDAEDQTVSEGEIFTLKINTNPDLTAYQFSLNADFLEVLEIIPGANQSPGDYGIFNQPSGSGSYVTSIVFLPITEFSIKFKALKDGKISDWLYFSNVLTPSLGYVESTQVDIELRFAEPSNTSASPDAGGVLYQNIPNPWQNATAIPFELPKASHTTIRITDVAGKVIATQTGWYPAGYHIVKFDQSQVKGNGIYYYQIETAGGVFTRKMVKG